MFYKKRQKFGLARIIPASLQSSNRRPVRIDHPFHKLIQGHLQKILNLHSSGVQMDSFKNSDIIVQKMTEFPDQSIHKTKSRFFKTKEKSSLFIGQIIELTITSEGVTKQKIEQSTPQSHQSLGIVSFLGGYTILVPKTELGDKVKVKIIKIHQAKSTIGGVRKKTKFAFAKVVQVLEKGQNKIPVSIGMNVNVKVIYSKDSLAIAKMTQNDNLSLSYFFVISQKNLKIGDQIEIIVTRLKKNYAFAAIRQEIFPPVTSIVQNIERNSLQSDRSGGWIHSDLRFDESNMEFWNRLPNIGNSDFGFSKFNIILPAENNSHQNFVTVFVRKKSNSNWTPSNFTELRSKFRIFDESKIQSSNGFLDVVKSPFICLFIKLGMGARSGDKVRVKMSQIFQSNSGISYAFAKIIKINPITVEKKQKKIKQNIEQMLKNSMHFGEKAVKCEAKMRHYIWIRKKGRNKNRPFIKKGRHFLNLLKTRRCLHQAQIQLARYAIKGRTFLFVGTKKPAASLISRAALFSQKSFFVNTRWLGGMLTNWKTILKSISKIRPILQEKQKIIQMILTKRQGIKLRLMKKILTSMKYIQKGRQFINKIKTNPSEFIEKNKTLTAKRKELIQKGQQLLFKRQQLLEKRKELYKKSKLLKDKGFQIVNKYENLLTDLVNQRKKLKELRHQVLLCKEIKKIKQNAMTINIRRGIIENSSILASPIPSKEIVNKILQGLGSSNAIGKSEKKYRLILLSKLLSKFSQFYSFIKTSMKTISENIEKILNILVIVQEAFKKIQNQMKNFINIKKKLLFELRKIKIKLVAEQKIIKLLKNKIKRMAAEKRFLKFLPKLRYLPTATEDATNSIQILMQKFVDPKIKQATSAMEIESSLQSKTKSKKIAAARKKKWQRLEKYFGGIANMLKMNKNKISKNVAIIIGQQEEMNAVRECQKLGIQMFHIVDTNCNPTLANHYVPANDDSRNSIQFILTKFLTHIRLAQKLRLRLWKSTSKKTTSLSLPNFTFGSILPSGRMDNGHSKNTQRPIVQETLGLKSSSSKNLGQSKMK